MATIHAVLYQEDEHALCGATSNLALVGEPISAQHDECISCRRFLWAAFRELIATTRMIRYTRRRVSGQRSRAKRVLAG